MATPVHYQTVTGIGMDPTVYYAVSASVTPEVPAPPYLTGTRAFGSDGTEFVFVQASGAVNLTDFVVLNVAASGGTSLGYMANSVTTTNIQSSLAVGLASTGLVLRQSVTTIPAGAYFWALTKGQYIPATTSGGSAIVQGTGTGLASNAKGCILTTSSVAGVLTSVTTSASLQAAILGIICVNSLTVSIPASIVPPAGDTKSNGYTVGPVVNINNPRPYVSISDSAGLIAGNSLNIFSF